MGLGLGRHLILGIMTSGDTAVRLINTFGCSNQRNIRSNQKRVIFYRRKVTFENAEIDIVNVNKMNLAKANANLIQYKIKKS